MSHSDQPPLPVPPPLSPSNYIDRALTTEENSIMNFIADRNVRRALNATIEQQDDSHLGGLYQVSLAYHDILFGVSAIGISA